MAGQNSTTNIRGASLETGGRQRGAASQVAATLVDSTPRYLPEFHDSNLSGLLQGLKAFNPALSQYQDKLNEEADARGALKGATGQDLGDDASQAEARAFLKLRGMKGGQDDLAAFQASLENDFDKENGDFDAFHREFFAERTKGLTEGSYTQAYTQVIAPGIAKLRAENQTYRQTQHRATIESTAMSLLDTGVKSYVAAGMPVDGGYVSSIRAHLTGELKVSNDRFNELLFDTLKRHADDGNHTVFEALKKENPDGTPGMYFDPRWKTKIDAAEVHAQNVFLTRKTQAEAAAKKDREDRQDKALLAVFMKADDGDIRGAQADFEQFKQSGLFQNATELISWSDKLRKAVNREARADQLERESSLQIGILEGRAGIRDVIAADITPAQRRSLIGEIARQKSEARADAREARADARARGEEGAKGVFKLPSYKQGREYIEGSLVPTDPTIMPSADGAARVKQAKASALLEYAERANGADPAQLPAIRDDIVKRWAPRINESARGSGGHTLHRYRDQAELAQAALTGGVSYEELKWGQANLPKRGAQQAQQPAQQSKGPK